MIQELRIFQKVRNGDIEAFESLFRHYYKPLCLYVCKITEDVNTAEEIVQDLFYKLWRDRGKIKVMVSGKSYLYGAARNNALQYLEHLRIKRSYGQAIIEKQDTDFPEANPQSELESKELENRLETILGNLPERRRQIFCLNRFDGKTYPEIASFFSLSIKTVEAEMSKALKVLRKGLEGYR